MRKTKTINNISDLLIRVKSINSSYKQKMLDLYGDWGRMLRVYTAKILLFFTFYEIFLLVSQIKPSLPSFSIFILLGGAIEVAPRIIGNDMPPVIGYLYKGEFFNEFNLKMLNFSIGLLLVLCGIFAALQKVYLTSGILKRNYGNR